MTKKSEYDFSGMNFADLQETHGEMQATALDLGIPLGAELAGGFTTEQDGRNICEALHKTIEQYRAGLNQDDEKTRELASASPGTRKPGAKSGGSKETNVAKKAVKKATAKKAAKKGKKAVAKKGAKKAVGGKKRAARADVLYELTAKGKKDSPYREGTERGNLFAKLKKHDSLNAFKKDGGEAWVLRIAIRDGLAKKKAA